jgi:hypothetical protein
MRPPDEAEVALRGADVVVDCLNLETVSRRKAEELFVGGSRRLLSAELLTGVRHHVLLSVAGIDGSAYPYYVAKRRQEEVVLGNSIPATIMRAAPFHEFVAQVVRRGRVGGLVLVPQMRFDPVAATEVASTLADLAAGAPRGRAPDVFGPRSESLVELARRLLAAQQSRALVVPLCWPGRTGRLMRKGASASPRDLRGRQTFDEWLDSLSADRHGCAGSASASGVQR